MVSRKYLLKILKNIAADYSIKLSYRKMHGEMGGWADLQKREITINSKYKSKLNDIVNTFFHELGHFKNLDTNKYLIYHNPKIYNTPVHLRPKAYWQNAWNAEVYTDKVGKKLMELYFPNQFKYTNAYGKHDKKWLLDYFRGQV